MKKFVLLVLIQLNLIKHGKAQEEAASNLE